MRNFTTDTHDTKRSIFRFNEKITKNSGKVEKKFVLDMMDLGQVHY